jgi:hypothetical protein
METLNCIHISGERINKYLHSDWAEIRASYVAVEIIDKYDKLAKLAAKPKNPMFLHHTPIPSPHEAEH